MKLLKSKRVKKEITNKIEFSISLKMSCLDKILINSRCHSQLVHIFKPKQRKKTINLQKTMKINFLNKSIQFFFLIFS